MYEELKKEKIIVELRDLINKADEFKDDVDCYCEFMRETFLALSLIHISEPTRPY
mgnify:CR=1 FL=1